MISNHNNRQRVEEAAEKWANGGYVKTSTMNHISAFLNQTANAHSDAVFGLVGCRGIDDDVATNWENGSSIRSKCIIPIQRLLSVATAFRTMPDARTANRFISLKRSPIYVMSLMAFENPLQAVTLFKPVQTRSQRKLVLPGMFPQCSPRQTKAA